MGFLNFYCDKCGMCFKELERIRREKIMFKSWTSNKRFTSTRYGIYSISDDEIIFIRGTSKPSWPIKYEAFKKIHDAICNGEIENTPREIDKFLRTKAECYLSSLFKYFRCGEKINKDNKSFTSRKNKIISILTKLGKQNDFIKFDQFEPEYKFFLHTKNKSKKELLCLIGVCAGIIDYQLAGNAFIFWNDLEKLVSISKLKSLEDIKNLFNDFLNLKVNKRLNETKRKALNKVFNSIFFNDFKKNFSFYLKDPKKLWQEVSQVTGRKKDMKTVTISMKIFDLFHLVYFNSYAFKESLPIPVDIHVRNITIFRIDSLLWQLGRTYTDNKDNWYQEVISYLTQKIQLSYPKAKEIINEMFWRILK
ncbi:MAG: N-glycosylase/DNA lyase [Candidatus Desulfofervidus auxilii]|nr:N-glycosylase/DNA lyase [Candidatus Desulfofervidus auxilii]